MSSIRTYNDLLEEKKRLEESLVIQKMVIRRDLVSLREEFKPALQLLSIAGKMTNLKKSNPLIGMAVNLAGELFLGNVLLSRAGKITRFVVPFLAKKASALFLNNSGSNIFQKMAG